MEGHPVFFHKHSDIKIEAFCEHFGICGGCKWQNLPYDEQLKLKQQEVIDNLERIGKIDLPEVNKIIPSEKTINYRNKLEFTFSASRFLTKEEIAMGDAIKELPPLAFMYLVYSTRLLILIIAICKMPHQMKSARLLKITQ